MQVTTKGQVTIPQEIRNRLGLLPNTEVEFELAGDHAGYERLVACAAEAHGDAWRWNSYADPATFE
jgi:AbrB family looped-hinge helix DNA binding protein